MNIPTGRMLYEGELVDAAESCDVDYACSYPPCVAARHAEGDYWALVHAATQHVVVGADDEAYEPGSPKRSDYFDGVVK